MEQSKKIPYLQEAKIFCPECKRVQDVKAAHEDDEQYITSPGLAVGSADSKKVLNGAFEYNINRVGYSKAGAETDLAGLSVVPQNKYGAYLLEIDSSGTITITAQASRSESTYRSTGASAHFQSMSTSDMMC